jgi:phage gp46-like protein
MADIEFFTDITGTEFDYQLLNGALAAEHDIKTAVMISLFTDRRADEGDALPDPRGSKRGWWADAMMGRQIGSRLWLLGREKQLNDVVRRAREYAEEALAWLVTEGVARNVQVQAGIARAGVLGLVVEVSRNNTPPARYRFEFAWQGATTVRN